MLVKSRNTHKKLAIIKTYFILILKGIKVSFVFDNHKPKLDKFPLNTPPDNFIDYFCAFVEHKLDLIEHLKQFMNTIIEYKNNETVEVEIAESKWISAEDPCQKTPSKGKKASKAPLSSSVHYDSKEVTVKELYGDIKNNLKLASIPMLHTLDEKTGHMIIESAICYRCDKLYINAHNLSEVQHLIDLLELQYNIKESEGTISTSEFVDDIFIKIPKYNIYEDQEKYLSSGENNPSQSFWYSPRDAFGGLFALPICQILQFFRQHDITPETAGEYKTPLVILLKNTLFSDNRIERKGNLGSAFASIQKYDTKEPSHKIQKTEYMTGSFLLYMYQTYNKYMDFINQNTQNKTKSKKDFIFSFDQYLTYAVYIGATSNTLISKNLVGEGGRKKYKTLSKAKNYIKNIYKQEFLDKDSKLEIDKIATKILDILYADLKYLYFYPNYKGKTLEELANLVYDIDYDRERYILLTQPSICNYLHWLQNGNM